MSFLQSVFQFLGLEETCNSVATKKIFSLGKSLDNFPSIDVFHKACPAIPRMANIEKAIDGKFKDFISANGNIIEAISVPFRTLLVFTEQVMLYTPWWIVVGAILGIVYLLTHKNLKFTAYVALALGFIGFFNMWNGAMQTLSFMFVCTVICIILGIPIGIWMSRSDRVQKAIVPILDILQTMPSFVYLIPVVMLFGVGKVPGAIAVIFYAIAPVIRLTDLGIRLVDKEVIEAADSFGTSSYRKLVDVQIPLAMPNIMAGVNQTIMMALALVVIASMVGVRGIGNEVLNAVTNQYLTKGLFNGFAIVILAIIIDRVSRSAVQKSYHLQRSEG